MSAQETDGSVTVGTQHPAFQALLWHAMTCPLCTVDAYCVTGAVLVKTLREASGASAGDGGFSCR
jgi:hypothetical protein